jgi:hypothetical protein
VYEKLFSAEVVAEKQMKVDESSQKTVTGMLIKIDMSKLS